MTDTTAVRIFQALGDPTRAALVHALARHGTASERVLAAPLPMSRQAVGKHLRVLSEAGIVSAARAGRETRYVLERAVLATAETWLAGVGAEWQHQLGLVKELAERPSAEA